MLPPNGPLLSFFLANNPHMRRRGTGVDGLPLQLSQLIVLFFLNCFSYINAAIAKCGKTVTGTQVPKVSPHVSE